jgi:hypothetical protein
LDQTLGFAERCSVDEDDDLLFGLGSKKSGMAADFTKNHRLECRDGATVETLVG